MTRHIPAITVLFIACLYVLDLERRQNPQKKSSSALYQAYRNYCLDTNEYVRNTADFYFALEAAGYERIVQNSKRFFRGIALKVDDGDFLG
jgi:hypothetical protein